MSISPPLEAIGWFTVMPPELVVANAIRPSLVVMPLTPLPLSSLKVTVPTVSGVESSRNAKALPLLVTVAASVFTLFGAARLTAPDASMPRALAVIGSVSPWVSPPSPGKSRRVPAVTGPFSVMLPVLEESSSTMPAPALIIPLR